MFGLTSKNEQHIQYICVDVQLLKNHPFRAKPTKTKQNESSTAPDSMKSLPMSPGFGEDGDNRAGWG